MLPTLSLKSKRSNYPRTETFTDYEDILIDLHQEHTGLAIPMYDGVNKDEALAYALVGHGRSSQTNKSKSSKNNRRKKMQEAVRTHYTSVAVATYHYWKQCHLSLLHRLFAFQNRFERLIYMEGSWSVIDRSKSN